VKAKQEEKRRIDEKRVTERKRKGKAAKEDAVETGTVLSI
jgi:hypothetical protein